MSERLTTKLKNLLGKRMPAAQGHPQDMVKRKATATAAAQASSHSRPSPEVGLSPRANPSPHVSLSPHAVGSSRRSAGASEVAHVSAPGAIGRSILAVLLAFTMMPMIPGTTQTAEAAAADTPTATPGLPSDFKVMNYGASGLNYSTVSWAGKTWSVIDEDGKHALGKRIGEDTASGEGKITLLLAQKDHLAYANQGDIKANGYVQWNTTNNSVYTNSVIQKAMDETIKVPFSDREKNALEPRNFTDSGTSGWTHDGVNGGHNGATVWPLSANEAKGITGEYDNINNNLRVFHPSGTWWLRSPYSGAIAFFVYGYGYMNAGGANSATGTRSARPAFFLDRDSVLFTSAAGAASGKKSASVKPGAPVTLATINEGTSNSSSPAVQSSATNHSYGNDHKLTVKDETVSDYALTSKDRATVRKGTVTVNFANPDLNTGKADFVEEDSDNPTSTSDFNDTLPLATSQEEG